MAQKSIQSPSYPSQALPDAIEAVRKIEEVYRGSPADRVDAAKLLGYSGSTGPANMALAALAGYGLVERAGKGMLRVTPLARSILHPSNESERVDGLRAAANAPRLYQEIRDHFVDLPVPPESGVVTYLNRRGFNPKAVPTAAKAFLRTAEWVQQLSEPESNGGEEQSEVQSDLPNAKFGGASVGDMIQWESQGALQFEKPRRVRWVSPEGDWLAVEGSDTGIPMSQAIIDRDATSTPPMIPPEQSQAPADAPTRAGQRKAVFPVSEGDVTFLFPDGMTEEGIEELEAYLAVFLKKEKRKAAKH